MARFVLLIAMIAFAPSVAVAGSHARRTAAPTRPKAAKPVSIRSVGARSRLERFGPCVRSAILGGPQFGSQVFKREDGTVAVAEPPPQRQRPVQGPPTAVALASGDAPMLGFIGVAAVPIEAMASRAGLAQWMREQFVVNPDGTVAPRQSRRLLGLARCRSSQPQPLAAQ